MLFCYADLSLGERYKLMSQSIIPRPIAWITTESKEGKINLAPFSYFTALSSEPPTLIVSIGHRPDGSPKDTLQNLRRKKRCTLCLARPELMEKLQQTAQPLKPTQSEAEIFDIALENRLDGYPPMVSHAPVAFFCELLQEIELDGSRTIPLILRISHQFVDDSIFQDQASYTIEWDPLGRVGKAYATLGERLNPPTN